MSKRMLIDGAHPEEIRVVVTTGNRLDEYDIETTFKKQIKGNIYLAKVTRVEPSLQAAFVDFGGNRHGFLAFSEIHPDYYQIPVEDRQALIEEHEELEMKARAAQEHLDDMEGGISDAEEAEGSRDGASSYDEEHDEHEHDDDHDEDRNGVYENRPADTHEDDHPYFDETDPAEGAEFDAADHAGDGAAADDGHRDEDEHRDDAHDEDGGNATEAAETASPRRSRSVKRYKIQEVIKRRQILLVQVVKEERGNKGAALTTYISLAGRYCVLMPNSSRGGGISRKITSAQERRKLRDTLNALDMPQGMGVIIRTAGLERSKAEIRRDFEYLLRAWDEVREVTLESTAPSLVYEEGNIIKRAIRDVYSKDIDEILVEGNDIYQMAKRFMRLMMPSHAKRVQPSRDDAVPLFQRFQIEQQLDAMHNPEVQLKSGGYIVINPTEALVAIDVNSGKSTRERNIEETALKTNIEAAEEVARQLRLRDLAGLIVIDFIDMEDSRNVRKVERRLREAMKVDRARLQIGRISNFGLLELSRQRLRPSLLETSTQICPHCRGTGHILSTESMAMRVLRAIEEEGIRMRSSEITVRVPTVVALYILNQKRSTLVDMESRYGFRVVLAGDDSVIPPDIEIERVKGEPLPSAQIRAGARVVIDIEEDDDVEDEIEDDEDEEAVSPSETRASPAPRDEDSGDADATRPPKRGRRRRGRRRERDDETRTERPEAANANADDGEAADEAVAAEPREAGAEGAPGDDDKTGPRRRRRGRRGGRRRNRPLEDGETAADGAAQGAEYHDDDSGERSASDAAPAETEADSAPAVTEAPAADVDMPAAAKAAEMPAEAAVADVAPPKPARRPRRAAAAAAEPAEAVVASVPEPETAPKPEPVPEPEPAPEPVAEAAVPELVGAEDQPRTAAPKAETPASDQPKRRGWWQRIVE